MLSTKSLTYNVLPLVITSVYLSLPSFIDHKDIPLPLSFPSRIILFILGLYALTLWEIY